MLDEQQIMATWQSKGPPLVSVMCVTFQRQEYFEQALDSILSQRTKFPFEVVIHDDASTDGTQDKILAYAQKYPNIIRTILRKDNIYSQGYKIQPLVVPHTKGKYIAFCDGDDYWTDVNKLQKQVDVLDANPDVFVCGHWTLNVDQAGNLMSEQSLTGATCPERFSLYDSLSGTIVHPNSWMYRRLDWQQEPHHNLINWLPVGDDPMMLILLTHGNGYCLQEYCSAYRLYSGGVWSALPTYLKYFKMMEFYIASLAIIPVTHWPKQIYNIAAIAFNILRKAVEAARTDGIGAVWRGMVKAYKTQKTMNAGHMLFALVAAGAYVPIALARNFVRKVIRLR